MRYSIRQLPGWGGTLFVAACCLGAGPVLASAALASGLGLLAGIFSIYVLGPLVVLSVGWTVWNTHGLGRRLTGSATGYPAFWMTLAGGALTTAGVFLPPFVAGSRPLASVLIYAGVALLAGGAVWTLRDQVRAADRGRTGREGPRHGAAGA